MQHPPYLPIDYLLDSVWSALLLIGAVLAWNSEIRWWMLFSVLSSLMLPLRFFPAPFFQIRVPPQVLELLSTLYLLAFSVATLWKAVQHWCKKTKNPQPL